MKSQGKSQEGSYKCSLGLYTELESVGYALPLHVVQLLCPEHYKGLHKDTKRFAGPTEPLEMMSLWKKVGFCYRK